MSEAPPEFCAGSFWLSVLAFAGSPLSFEAAPESSGDLSCCCISTLPFLSRLSELPPSFSLQQQSFSIQAFHTQSSIEEQHPFVQGSRRGHSGHKKDVQTAFLKRAEHWWQR